MKINVSAIQMPSKANSTQENLEQAHDLIERATKAGAQLVLLPELFGQGYDLSYQSWNGAEPIDGPIINWMKQTSRFYNVYIGGTVLIAENGHFHNSFVLTNPKGRIQGRVDKQWPAGVEGFLFKGGSPDRVDNHIIQTPFGPIGIGICYENFRSDLLQYFKEHQVRLVLMPYSFPKMNSPWSPRPLSGTDIGKFYAQQIGSPIVVTHKVGAWTSQTILTGNETLVGRFPGTSAIINGKGETVDVLGTETGFAIGHVALTTAPDQNDAYQYAGQHIAPLVKQSLPGIRGLLTRMASTVQNHLNKPSLVDSAREHYDNNEKRRQIAERIEHSETHAATFSSP